jgi:hypothetical protein
MSPTQKHTNVLLRALGAARATVSYGVLWDCNSGVPVLYKLSASNDLRESIAILLHFLPLRSSIASQRYNDKLTLTHLTIPEDHKIQTQVSSNLRPCEETTPWTGPRYRVHKANSAKRNTSLLVDCLLRKSCNNGLGK